MHHGSPQGAKRLEAKDRMLRDEVTPRGNDDVMGGIPVLLGGDLCQTLPVIPGSTPADELNAGLKSSHLWTQVQQIELTTNVRAPLHGDGAQIFANQLLDLGNGRPPFDASPCTVKLPVALCNLVDSLTDLVAEVFVDIRQNYTSYDWLRERVLLAHRNDSVQYMNDSLLETLRGDATTYMSIDTVTNVDDAVCYPTEFLNPKKSQACRPTYYL